MTLDSGVAISDVDSGGDARERNGHDRWGHRYRHAELQQMTEGITGKLWYIDRRADTHPRSPALAINQTALE